MTPEAFAVATNVSRETMTRFRDYEALLQKWSRAINLVARSTLDSVWERHFLDSVQLLDYVDQTAETWVDLGAGAGFPGLAVAIAASEKHPSLMITLVESDRRKCAFLSEVARKTGVSVRILPQRIETLQERFDVVSARALAPLPQLLAWAAPLMRENGAALFLKGRTASEELTQTDGEWHSRVEQFPSRAAPDGVVLRIRPPAPR